MSWRIGAAAVIAFVIGVAAGGFAEHERVQSNKVDGTAAETSTTTSSAPTADWFGGQTATACPVLTNWFDAIGRTSYAAASKGPWTATRAALLEEATAIGAAYEALLPAANAAGKPEVAFLIAYQDRSTEGLQSSTSAAEYAESQHALASERLNEGVNVLLQTARYCPKS